MAKNEQALDQAAAKHPNAFVTQAGVVMYRYKGEDGDSIITPKPIEEMSQDDFLNLPITLGEQQSGRLPQNLTVVFKDKQWAGHWFNKKAGSAARVSVARTLGFVPAKVEDLESWHSDTNDRDGAVEQHDLVLMKIHKAKLYAKFKQWIDVAKVKGGIGGYKASAESSLSPANRDNVEYYHTPQALREKQGLGPVEHLKEVNR